MNPTIVLMLLGTLTTTAYRSVPSQTDNSPFITSIGEHVHKYGCAVSQDLLCPASFGRNKAHSRLTCTHKNKLHYGDWLYIEGYGLRVINDCMAARHKQRIDLWVSDYKEEKAIGVRHKKIYVLEGLK